LRHTTTSKALTAFLHADQEAYIKRVVSYLVSALRALGPVSFNCVPGNLVPTRSNMPCCVLLAAQKPRNAFAKTVF